MASIFTEIRCQINGASNLSLKTKIKYFRSYFLTSPVTCEHIWRKISYKTPQYFSRQHLLWELYFLLKYPTVTQIKKLFDVEYNTFKKYAFKIIRLLKELRVVSS